MKSIEIFGVKIEFKERTLSAPAEVLMEIEKATKGRQLVLVFDEAQELRFFRGFDKFLAYVYDHVEGIKLVLSGSEAGLLEKFIGVSNPEAPLFGRGFEEIQTKRLDAEKALEFLKEGFSQAGVSVSMAEMEEAVSKLDGIIGWLTLYGYMRAKGHSNALELAIAEGSRLSAEELKRFLDTRQTAKRRYIELMKLLTKPSRWSEVRRGLRAYSNVSDKQISNYFKELSYYGFIGKEGELYKTSDPMLVEALKRGYII